MVKVAIQGPTRGLAVPQKKYWGNLPTTPVHQIQTVVLFPHPLTDENAQENAFKDVPHKSKRVLLDLNRKNDIKIYIATRVGCIGFVAWFVVKFNVHGAT